MSLEIRHELLQKDYEILSKKLEILSVNYDKLLEERDSRDSHIYRLLEENEILKTDLKRSKTIFNENAELKETLKRYKKGVASSKDSAIKALTQRVAELEGQLQEAIQSEEQAKIQVNTMSIKIKSMAETLGKVNGAIEIQTKEFNSLSEKYNKLLGSNKTKDQRIARMETQIKCLTDEAQKHTNQSELISNLENEKGELKKKLERILESKLENERFMRRRFSKQKGLLFCGFSQKLKQVRRALAKANKQTESYRSQYFN